MKWCKHINKYTDLENVGRWLLDVSGLVWWSKLTASSEIVSKTLNILIQSFCVKFGYRNSSEVVDGFAIMKIDAIVTEDMIVIFKNAYQAKFPGPPPFKCINSRRIVWVLNKEKYARADVYNKNWLATATGTTNRIFYIYMCGIETDRQKKGRRNTERNI